MNGIRPLFFSLLLLLTIGLAVGDRDSLAETPTLLKPLFETYQKGDYAQTIQKIEKIQDPPLSQQALLLYLKGLCFSRLQNFDQAIPAFEYALQKGATYEDLHYELAQALYTSQKLKQALQQFKLSEDQGYKKGISRYYRAYIYQLLDEPRTAYDLYSEITQNEKDPDHVKQAALMQMAEIKLSLALQKQDAEKRLTLLKQKAVPAFQDVVDFEQETPVYAQAKTRLEQLQEQIEEEDRSRFANGSPNPPQRWTLRATEDLKYDTNVVTRANDAILAVSDVGSFLAKTDAYGKYQYTIDRRFVILPEFDLSYTKYSNQTEPYVFQNDNITGSFNLKTRYEHTYNDKPATLSFNLETTYFMRDWQFIHSLLMYSRSYNLVMAERLPLFPFGGTTLSGNFKFFNSVDNNQNALNPGLILSQNVQLPHGTGLLVSLGTDYNRAVDSFYDRKDYRLTTSVNFPEVYEKINVSLVLDLTLVDTMNQFADRGLEKTISPGLVLNRFFTPHFFANASYSYTDNISLDQQVYAYSKHTFGIGVGAQL